MLSEKGPDQRETMAALRHDLGKYVCFEARWLGEDAGAEALRDALRADLLRTRRGPTGEEPAAAIWARLRPGTPAGPDRDEVEARVAALAGRAGRLAEADEAELRETARLARELAERIRAWVQGFTRGG